MKTYQEAYELVCEMLSDAKDLDINELSAEMPLHYLRLDSLDYVELMVLAKREFGYTLNAELFISQPNMTLGELCHLLIAEDK
jgi:acyl carrier protein